MTSVVTFLVFGVLISGASLTKTEGDDLEILLETLNQTVARLEEVERYATRNGYKVLFDEAIYLKQEVNWTIRTFKPILVNLHQMDGSRRYLIFDSFKDEIQSATNNLKKLGGEYQWPETINILYSIGKIQEKIQAKMKERNSSFYVELKAKIFG